jgi:hypothetical protein
MTITIQSAWYSDPSESADSIQAQTYENGIVLVAINPAYVAALEAWVSAGSTIDAYAPPPPTNVAVTAEAERRIEGGVVVTVPGHTPTIYVQGRDKDTRNVQGLVTAAQLRLASGDTTTLTSFRDGNNVMHELTPAQVVALWQESAVYVTTVYNASWVIKAMAPIPADYADDSYWP